METWDRISALGGAGALRIWRAAIHFLSARVVGVGSGTEQDFSLGRSFGHLHLAGAGGGGRGDVFVSAAMAGPARRNFRSRAVCGESLPSGDCVLAECVRRTAGGVPAATAGVGVVARGGTTRARDDFAGVGSGGFVAGECSGGGDDSLFDGFAGFSDRVAEEIGTHSADEWDGGYFGCGAGRVLFVSRGL
jgi:hypothetical protein